ncbi:MAG: ankyrin repeat domain-containing protein [Puniceicoccales bacterium]|nr:ankyrin repeat domain-containing protein [Puniceicoccales bacterium]
MDELVSSRPKERPELKESFTLDKDHELEEISESEKEADDIVRLIQATKNFSDVNAYVSILEILMNHADKDDLDLILQALRENLDRNDRELVIEYAEEYLDIEGRIRELQILEEHLEHNNLPFSALSEENRKFVEECNPVGCKSEVYVRLLNKLLRYLLGQDSSWEKLFKHPVARQFKLRYTPKKLCQMNIDLEKLILIELIIALRKRELTPKEKSKLEEAILTLDRSPERRLLNAIGSAFRTPKRAFKIAKSIIQKRGVDVNSLYKGMYPTGSSFLLKAAEVYRNKGLKIVRLLLDHGADVNSPNEWTALHGAVREENIEVVRLLLAHGANVNLKARSLHREGWTPLHVALHYEFFNIAKLLLDHGADPNIRNDEGQTPLELIIAAREKIYDEEEKKIYDPIIDALQSYTP